MLEIYEGVNKLFDKIMNDKDGLTDMYCIQGYNFIDVQSQKL